MTIQTLSSRAFNQDPTAAKRAALLSPVQITDRGRVSHVLISIEQYQKLTDSPENIVDLLAMPEGNDIEFEPPILNSSSIKPVEFG
ncbi:MAG: type II toxin-antitoxin system Phd/YefM family antitoxin [Methylococcales bacterium]|nr:type II toxin-antitoxin system Phd/YefM family antitoxin [Methylococcales bacterium]